MARREEITRIEELERRSSQQEREMVILADTIKELATQLQTVARSQVELLEARNELFRQLADLDARTPTGNDNA